MSLEVIGGHWRSLIRLIRLIKLIRLIRLDLQWRGRPAICGWAGRMGWMGLVVIDRR